jgi:hypothetical protein
MIKTKYEKIRLLNVADGTFLWDLYVDKVIKRSTFEKLYPPLNYESPTTLPIFNFPGLSVEQPDNQNIMKICSE